MFLCIKHKADSAALCNTLVFRLVAALALEGVAVYALALGRMRLMRADADRIQGAVVLRTAVVAAGGNGAVNVRVFLLVFHNDNPLAFRNFAAGSSGSNSSITHRTEIMQLHRIFLAYFDKTIIECGLNKAVPKNSRQRTRNFSVFSQKFRKTNRKSA